MDQTLITKEPALSLFLSPVRSKEKCAAMATGSAEEAAAAASQSV